MEKCIPDKRVNYWQNLADDPEDLDWEEINLRNFKFFIDTRPRSFYFKVFHNAIALNDVLFKIKRKDSPNCDFCKKLPENIIHLLTVSVRLLNLFGMIWSE